MEALITLSKYSMIVTALFMLIGGFMGFKKAQSKISLIAGGGSALLLSAAFLISMTDTRTGLIAGFIIVTILEAMFVMRIAKTKKFMPSGMMLLVCGFAGVLLILGLLVELKVI